ncbi:MAG: hypothetical protein R8M46_06215, partial [Ghiorsea sp.]
STSGSHEAGVSLTGGVEEEVKIGTGGAEAANTFSASITGHDTNTNTEGHETSTSWNDETSGENSTAHDEGESFESNNAISTSDGDVLVSVKVVNRGNVAYTLNNLFLNASYFDQASNQPFVPIGSLQFDDPTNSQFPAFTLSPGQATGVMTFKTSPLNVGKVKKLLTNSRGMSIKPSIMDMLDQDGVSYNFSSTGIGSQDALVKIDYIGNGGRTNITKRVAVHGDPAQVVNANQILNDILRVNAVVTDASGTPAAQGVINAVDGLTNNGQSGFWIMMHGKNQGNNEIITTTYTTPDDRTRWIARGSLDPNIATIVDDYDLSQITINGGDILHLFYMQDSDLDGLPNVQEFFYRSDPFAVDTDNDGLDDSTEVKGWEVSWENEVGSTLKERVYSSPTLADTDGDGVNDFDEANLTDANLLNRRNPRTKDTDGDSIVDSIDDKTGVLLGNNVYQNLSIRDFATTVTLVTGAKADVYASFTLPTSLYQMPGNGYSEYSVAVYRLVDATATFPSPNTGPLNGVLPILGDTLPCTPPAAAGCPWVAVSVYNASVNAGNKPTTALATHGFTETGLLPANSSAQYIAYISVNNRWKRTTVDALATSNAEIIRFTMHPGLISNAKTLVGPNHHAGTTGNFSGRHDSTNYNWYYFPKNNPAYQWSISGWTQSPWQPLFYEQFIRTAETYDRFDVGYGVDRDVFPRSVHQVDVGTGHFVVDIGGTVIEDTPVDYWEPPITYPYFKGDGKIDLKWWLTVGGKRLYNSGVQAIDGTYHANLAATAVTPFVDAVPESGGVPVYSGAKSVLVNTLNPSPNDQTGVFEIALPAVEQCYDVDLGENEIDANLPGGINQTIDYDSTTSLCRDNSLPGSGIWTLTNKTTGKVLGSTRKGNITPVTFNGYVYWREVPPTDQSVPWTHDTSWHAVSKEFDLKMGFDMTVR